MIRVPFDTLYGELNRVLLGVGFEANRAALCARLFAETSRDGVYSHGLNRFPSFIRQIEKGYVDIHAEPGQIEAAGLIERWDGRYGPGNLNAYASMNRAIELARESGIGCVALKNTNHWNRAGTYGWQAANSSCMAVAWTNTVPNMPAWGGKNLCVGNNPLVVAVPRANGDHVVLDFAMSLYSYGKMNLYARNEELLPYDGGFDSAGKLTRNPTEILTTRRALPAGLWKGSGLAFVLDLMSLLLSGGRSTFELSQLEEEHGVSQVFIALDGSKLVDSPLAERLEDSVRNLNDSPPDTGSVRVNYPGERTLQTRGENLRKGIPVDEEIWSQVKGM